MNRCLCTLSLLLCVVSASVAAAVPDYLVQCWTKQAKPLQDSWLTLLYREQKNSFYHSPRPWQVLSTQSTGRVQCNAHEFFQLDTVRSKEDVLVSRVQYAGGELLQLPYWRKDVLNATRRQLAELPLAAARYSPALLVEAALQQPRRADTVDAVYAVYTLLVNKSVLKLFVRKSDALLEKITALRPHDVLGDVCDTLLFSDFAQTRSLWYPRRVDVANFRGVRDIVELQAAAVPPVVEPLVERPEGYRVEDGVPVVPEVVVEKLAERVYGVLLRHAETRSLLVEFRDFFVAADVPLSSANGELVLREAERIAPGKPVRYVVASHFHDWYMGAVRPFVQRGATVLCTKENIGYVEYLASAPHSLQPDSLYVSPRPLKTQLVDSVLVIADDSCAMQIYHIGMMSGHTEDYLLFYFPQSKLLCQGDLAWIPKTAPPVAAGRTQKALYAALQKLNVDVETIAQSWPVGDKRNVKTLFSLAELRESVEAK